MAKQVPGSAANRAPFLQARFPARWAELSPRWNPTVGESRARAGEADPSSTFTRAPLGFPIALSAASIPAASTLEAQQF